MNRVSESIRDLLVRQGIEAGRAGNTGRHGIGDGERSRESALSHQLAQPGESNRANGMGKGAPAETGASQQGGKRQHGARGSSCGNHGTLRLIVNPNLSDMLKRGRTHPRERLPTFGVRPRLNIIQGGKN